MKLRVLFLKKKYIYVALLLIITIILLFLFIHTSKNNTISTFKVLDNNKVIRTDLTGDGNDDIIYIKSENKKYYIQVNTSKNNSLFLTPNKHLNTMGIHYSYWPLRLTLLDVTRDKIPELFIQSSKEDKPIQHVFLWNNNKFNNIIFNNNNILGFLNCNTNKTPIVLSGNYNKSNITLNSSIILNNHVENFNEKHPNYFIGKDTIFYLIKYIESLPQKQIVSQEIIHPSLGDNILPSLDYLNNLNKRFVFQDALFMNKHYDKDGNLSEIQWTLNFKGISLNNEKDFKNYTANISLKKDKKLNEDFYLKISSFKVK